MKTTMKTAAIGILLPLTAVSAMAQSALQELKLRAGVEAVAAVEPAAPAPSSLGAEPTISAATAAKIQAAFRSLKARDFPGVKWNYGSLGMRYIRVPLQPESCLDDVSYAALVPVGVLYPGAPAADPNRASYFILVRTGKGIGPESRYSAPVAMPTLE